jgi:hypothetical protein
MQTLKIPKNSTLVGYEYMRVRRDYDNTYCSTSEYLTKQNLVYNDNSCVTYRIGDTTHTRSIIKGREESPEPLVEVEIVEERAKSESPDIVEYIYVAPEYAEYAPPIDPITRYYQKNLEYYNAVRTENRYGNGVYNGRPLIERYPI